jgi:hypothetical protein
MRRSSLLAPSAWSRAAQAVLPWLIGLAFIAVEVRRVSGQVAVRYPDFFTWAERASRFDLHHLAEWQWVDGLYPLGYPLLLRLGVALGADVLRVAFAISILGGFLGLLATFWLVRRMTGEWALAVLTEFGLGCMAYYLFFGNLDSTDMLAAGLQLLSFPLLLRETRRRSAGLIAGLLVGLSYLVRYTATLPFLLCTLFLLGAAGLRRDREGLVVTGLYLLGGMVGAAPQWIASAVVTGNPLYNTQAHNLWFHLLGSGDYIRDWNAVPLDISLWQVVASDPARFFGHWWGVFQTVWPGTEFLAVDLPLGVLAQAGFIFALLAPGQMRRPARVFMLLYTAGMLALLAFTRYDRRFLITLMPFEVLCCLYFLWTLFPARVGICRWRLPVRVPLLLCLLAFNVRYPLHFMLSNPADETIVAVSNTLHAAGMTSARQVFSTPVEFHDVSDPWKRRFDMAFALARDLTATDALLDFVHDHGYRFFIFDRQTGLFLYPDMEGLLLPENRPAGLTPVLVQEERDFVVYRVEENSAVAPRPSGARLENGITLTGYETFVSRDDPRGERWVGLYLHWQTATPLTTSLKVFVHLIDADGQLVAQHDSVPALWTYPTDRWAVGEEVVDFHPLHFDPTLGRGPFTIYVGLYDPQTGRRVPLSGADGPPGEDRIEVDRITD